MFLFHRFVKQKDTKIFFFFSAFGGNKKKSSFLLSSAAGERNAEESFFFRGVGVVQEKMEEISESWKRERKEKKEKWAGGEDELRVSRRGGSGCLSQYLEIDSAERKQKKQQQRRQQRSGTSRRFPYRYFMERKSLAAPAPPRSEVRWGWRVGWWRRRWRSRQRLFFSPNGFLTRGTAD